mgnify:CR=1 FL=1
MGIHIIKKEEQKEVARVLVSYWKSRGMKKHTQKWALEYLQKGHKKEIVKDEFFVYNEDKEMKGVVSGVTFHGNVAEIRDEVAIPRANRELFKRIIIELVRKLKQRKVRKVYTLALKQTKKAYKELGFKQEGLLRDHFKRGEDVEIWSKLL